MGIPSSSGEAERIDSLDGIKILKGRNMSKLEHVALELREHYTAVYEASPHQLITTDRLLDHSMRPGEESIG